jgi:shikimate kinase
VQNIYLVGFMGSGKSVVGRALARRLGCGFVDVDAAVEARLGMSIPEVFATRGEDGFRTVETEELSRTTGSRELVVATGGGAFSIAENRRLIHDSGGVSVFLDVPWAVIASRLRSAAASRPKWVDDAHARRLFDDRQVDYRSASVRLRLTGDETPDEIAGRIAGEVTETACAS